MNAVFISLSIIIVLLNLGLIFEIKIEYDLLKNLGKFHLKLFGIQFLVIPFTVVDKYLELTTKKKILKIKIDFSDEKIIFIERLGIKIQSKIYLERLGVGAVICQQNPLLTAMIGGLGNILINIFLLKVKINRQDASLYSKIDTGFRHEFLQLFFDAKFMISLFDIVSSIMITIIKMWGEGYEKRQEKYEQ